MPGCLAGAGSAAPTSAMSYTLGAPSAPGAPGRRLSTNTTWASQWVTMWRT